MENHPTIRDRKKAETLVLERIDIGPVGITEMALILVAYHIPMPRTVASDAFLSLVEQGKARFNTKWLLEVNCERTEGKEKAG